MTHTRKARHNDKGWVSLRSHKLPEIDHKIIWTLVVACPMKVGDGMFHHKKLDERVKKDNCCLHDIRKNNFLTLHVFEEEERITAPRI